MFILHLVIIYVGMAKLTNQRCTGYLTHLAIFFSTQKWPALNDWLTEAACKMFYLTGAERQMTKIALPLPAVAQSRLHLPHGTESERLFPGLHHRQKNMEQVWVSRSIAQCLMWQSTTQPCVQLDSTSLSHPRQLHNHLGAVFTLK